ncbi:Hypothetical predicted protein [Octopus vulgaris]|uniref:Uncharacterized protein n=1 Tax=Octopus vulgaris TaxID=6645 RepID=A0AA36BBA9_OCTVU|nr:Hypothetical predicted protein [Octopus vulgaris]
MNEVRGNLECKMICREELIFTIIFQYGKNACKTSWRISLLFVIRFRCVVGDEYIEEHDKSLKPCNYNRRSYLSVSGPSVM